MHDVVENFAAAGAVDRRLFLRAWRNAYPFIVVGAVWDP
jgi:hypothetical protein